MARLFVQYLAIYNNVNLPQKYWKISQACLKFCIMLSTNPQKIVKDFWQSAKVAKFRQIWSRWWKVKLKDHGGKPDAALINPF